MPKDHHSEQVIIVGGGVAGLGTAAELSRAGLPVIVLEAEALGARASTHNQGWLHSGGIFARADLELARLCWQSAQKIIRDFPRCLEHGRRPDSAGMYFVSSQAGTMMSEWRNAWDQAGIPFKAVTRDDFFRDVPQINKELIQQVYLLPDRAFRPEILLEELAGLARNAGAEIRTQTKVSELLIADGAVHGVKTSAGETLSARHVILSTGGVLDELVPHRPQFDQGQPAFERVSLKTHLVAIRPDIGNTLFTFVDWHELNHIPHLQTSVFHSGRWLPTKDGNDTQIDPHEMALLWSDIQSLFPNLNRSTLSHQREWAATTTQAMGADQVFPGVASRPAVMNHGANGGPQCLWSVTTGRLTLWPVVVEELRREILSHQTRGPLTASSPPWGLSAEKSDRPSASNPETES